MPCSCEHTECLRVAIDRCDDATTIALPLNATATGTWRSVVEFNGISRSESIAVTNGQPIVISNNLNENYEHVLKLFQADRALFNDTCYLLKTSITL